MSSRKPADSELVKQIAQLEEDQERLRELADATLTILLENKDYMRRFDGPGYPAEMEMECRGILRRLGLPAGSTNGHAEGL